MTARSEKESEHWLAEGLKSAGLAAKDLAALKGSDPRKLALAELLWKQTTVSQEWIAESLSMRSAANVSQQLRRLDRAETLKKVPPGMRKFLAGARESRRRDRFFKIFALTPASHADGLRPSLQRIPRLRT